MDVLAFLEVYKLVIVHPITFTVICSTWLMQNVKSVPVNIMLNKDRPT